jgi:hypothetical protein
MIYVLQGLLVAIVLFLAVVILRTLTFKPKKLEEVDKTEEIFDKDKAISNLQTLIKFKTVSYRDSSLEDDSEFEGLIAKLPELYPNVFEKCEFMRFENRGLLFKWKGKGEGDASVMMAHYDVAPVDESKWDKAPFDGIIEDGSQRSAFPNGLAFYTYARTLYDSSLSSDDLIEDYFSHIYGEDWKLFREYLSKLAKAIPFLCFRSNEGAAAEKRQSQMLLL